ncbi:MAG: Ig-like domain-containing protein, partial [Gammaproteobacteria bacterium]
NDNAGNSTTTADTTNATVDNIAPTLTDTNLSINTGSGTGGAFIIGDTVTATWDNTSSGDNNSDTIAGLTANFTAFGGGSAVAASESSGTWTATYVITSGVVDATDLNIAATATDNAGNTSTTADSSNVTVDNQALTVTDANVSLSGASGAGGVYIAGDTVTAAWNNTDSGDNNGDTVAAVSVDFSAFGGGSAVAASDSSGVWSATYTLSTASTSGTNLNVSVSATDNAGNVTTQADSSNVTIDVGVPSVSSVTSSTADGSYKAGVGISIQVLFSDTVFVTGTPQLTLETGTTDRAIQYSSGSGSSTLVFAYTVQAGDSSADLDYLSTSALALNSGTINDANGNAADLSLAAPGSANSLSANKALIIDTAQPVLAEVTAVTTPTTNTTPTVTFSTSETGTVSVSGTCGTSSSTTLSSTGQHTITLTQTDNSTALTDGTYSDCAITVTDAAGNVSSALSLTAFTVDTTAPAVSSTPDLADASDTGLSSTDNITRDTNPTFTGTAEANATLALSSDLDGALGNTTVDSTGNWSLTLGSALSEGTHSVTATVTDAVGNASSVSSALNVTIDTTAPAAPSTPDLDASSDLGSDASDHITSDNTPSLSGTAEANATVTLSSDQDGTVGSASVDGSGNWTVTSNVLSDATHSITLTATDVAGNTSTASSALSITVDTIAPTVLTLSPSDDATTAQYNDDVVMTFTESVVAGLSGANSVSLYQADATLHESVAANDSAVTVSAAVVTVNPSTNFTVSESYYVNVGAAAFSDIAGNYFAGISDDSTWNFSLTNHSPQSVNDTASTDEDAAVAIAVLANDTDEDSSINPASVTVTSAPSHGSASVNTATGVITYTPTADYNGSDSFTYTVEDVQGGLSNTATVSLSVNAVNDNPVAANDLTSTTEDTAVSIAVAANDTDIDSGDSVDTAALQVVSGPSHGTAAVVSGEILYTPSLNFNGSDSFTYTIGERQQQHGRRHGSDYSCADERQ